MGGAREGFPETATDEEVAEITALLAAFDPKSSDRYERVNRRVLDRPKLFRKGKPTDTYAVAWYNSLSASSKNGKPLSVRMHSRLIPSVWATSDHQLVENRYDLWIVTTPQKIHVSQHRALLLGLQGDFATIDREFEAARQSWAARLVDSAVRELNDKAAQIAATHPLERVLLHNQPPTIDTSAPDFEELRDQLIKELLVK